MRSFSAHFPSSSFLLLDVFPLRILAECLSTLSTNVWRQVIIPHYQRVSANGEREDSSGVSGWVVLIFSCALFKKCKLLPQVPLEDLKSLSGMLVKAMEIRERYMRFSHQKFPGFVKRWAWCNGQLRTEFFWQVLEFKEWTGWNTLSWRYSCETQGTISIWYTTTFKQDIKIFKESCVWGGVTKILSSLSGRTY